MNSKITLQTSDLLTVQQFAQRIKHPRVTVYRWIEKGRINAILLGRTLYIPIAELDKINHNDTDMEKDGKPTT